MTISSRTPCIGRPLGRTAALKLALATVTDYNSANNLGGVIVLEVIHNVVAKNQDNDEIPCGQQRLTPCRVMHLLLLMPCFMQYQQKINDIRSQSALCFCWTHVKFCNLASTLTGPVRVIV